MLKPATRKLCSAVSKELTQSGIKFEREGVTTFLTENCTIEVNNGKLYFNDIETELADLVWNIIQIEGNPAEEEMERDRKEMDASSFKMKYGL
ncbi:hypothetical protein [Paenibacillus humicus]|uniref:hypothetical protein n=1 Tax=Paenibacillus humicus TaxID=412861 RepID=UPI000FD7A90C|nr:hypothetical protein [Paenibacillus humicus]